MKHPDESVFEHVRGRDRERLGWIRLTEDSRFVAFDLLWRPVCEPTGLDAAEAALEAVGLGYLAEDWWLTTNDGRVRVQIVAVHADRLVVASVTASEHVAKALDLTTRIELPNPTKLLTESTS